MVKFPPQQLYPLRRSLQYPFKMENRKKHTVCLKTKKKRVKFALKQAMKTQRGSRGTALLFL
jgi:hypothetical protein